MPALTNLTDLLRALDPKLHDEDFVFCTVVGDLIEYLNLNPIATFKEQEGLTLILEKSRAREAELDFDGTYKQISLSVHSSLTAVGLTAAVSSALASKGISANVVAAYYHDHIFVPATRAADAVVCLNQLTERT